MQAGNLLVRLVFGGVAGPDSSPSEIWDSSVRFGEWHCTQVTDLVKHNQAILHKIVEASLARQQNVVCWVS